MNDNTFETEVENQINNTTTEIQEKTENEATIDTFELSEEDIERINTSADEVLKELEEVDNMLLETQEVEEQSDNTIEETQEAENKIIEVETSNNKSDTSNTEWTDISNMEWLDILAKLSVPYNDPSVLLTNSKELETVNKFFGSISCRR